MWILIFFVYGILFWKPVYNAGNAKGVHFYGRFNVVSTVENPTVP